MLKLNRPGRPARFVYLNEDQPYFALTLSDSTINSVRLKKKLIKEFSAYIKLAKRQANDKSLSTLFDGSLLAFAVALFGWRERVMGGISDICDGLDLSRHD